MVQTSFPTGDNNQYGLLAVGWEKPDILKDLERGRSWVNKQIVGAEENKPFEELEEEENTEQLAGEEKEMRQSKTWKK